MTAAIAGCGRIGKLYAKLIAEERTRLGLRLVAAADPNVDLGMPDVQQFRNPEELLKLPVNAILIASPPDSHYKIAKLALKSGKHTLVEKPPAASAAEGEELISIARDRGLTVFFAYHARYNCSVRAAKEALTGAAIENIEITYRENVLQYHDPQSWVFQEGVLKDSGVNALSVLGYVLPAECRLDVTQATFVRSRRFDAITQARLALKLEAGASGSMTLDWTETGAERRDIAIRATGTEFLIDIVSDRLMRGDEIICSGHCEHERLVCEYREMLDDFAVHISAPEPSSDTSELRLLDTANRIAEVVDGP